ncbi:MAG: FadR family transcriptional regulator [Oscillatoriophycideae cyanobacterium NC_groundwater_1537_Pr4_S-0.65um_50_18]|nr:FadR family transcriptional regulator [Oscillatoriophycideae cyanobacterium NC_groundwater_1537_Pr4_S-0.65um_50_18]
MTAGYFSFPAIPKRPMLTPAEALLRGLKPTTNAFEVTIERLGSVVRMGLYEPGARLPSEREIAEIMGISRTTVREAIRVLSEQGILTVKRGRAGGTFVSETLMPPNVMQFRRQFHDAGRSLSDILDHRLIVEAGIAELAAQRATIEHTDELQDLIHAMRHVEDDFTAYRKLDTRFHLVIAQATNNSQLQAVIADIHADLSELALVVPYSKAALTYSTSKHQKIVDAIKARRACLARQLMQEHVKASNSFLTGLLG